MREILFRGKREGNVEWVEGSLVHQTQYYGDPVDRYHIIYDGEFDYDYYRSERVISKTVCQYTGVTDVNGGKIFEGDVVEVYCATGELRSSGVVVHWDDFFSGWVAGKYSLYGRSTVMSFKVVGNVYDNPELVEGGAE